MNIVKQQVFYLSNCEDENYLKFIETVGRICYQSKPKSKNDVETLNFVKGLIKNCHYSVLEHWNFHFKILADTPSLLEILNGIPLFHYAKYSGFDEYNLLTVSLRTLIELRKLIEPDNDNPIVFITKWFSSYMYHLIMENTKKYSEIELLDGVQYSNFLNDLSVFLGDDIIKLHTFHTLKFICDRGISHELVRHRPCSYAMESTRYCNYLLNKFSNSITCVPPTFNTPEELVIWKRSCESAELNYFTLLTLGVKPEIARSVLPHSLKTELILTTNELEWEHILDLRYRGITGSPHPQMKELMRLALKILVFESNGRIKE